MTSVAFVDSSPCKCDQRQTAAFDRAHTWLSREPV